MCPEQAIWPQAVLLRPRARGSLRHGRSRLNPDQVGFAVNPRRWVVERFFAWIGRNRRLAKDFKATIETARAFYAASVLLVGSLALHEYRKPTLRGCRQSPAHQP